MTAELDLARAIADAVDAKVANMRPESSTMPAVYQGTDSEGKGWVLLPGATEPTPVSRMAVEAAQGDTVSVTIANGKATVDSNMSNPSAGIAGVKTVERTANTANETAGNALVAAADARSAANSAQASADTARQAATDATVDAATARSMAESATADAVAANESAQAAQTSANEAQAEAESATRSANAAMFGLSEVENVVGTLNWIAEHGEYVSQAGEDFDKSAVYYTRSGSGTDEDPYVYMKVGEPVEEDIDDYYLLVVDESVQNYIASHLALTDEGLFVMVDGVSGRLKLSSDGVYVMSGEGVGVASFTNSGVWFDGSVPQTVGGDEAYIRYYDSDDDDAADALEIVADSVTVGGSDVAFSLSSMREAIDGATATLESVVSGLTSSSHFTQTEDGFAFTLDSALQDAMDAADDARKVATDYLAFEDGELSIGASDAEVKAVLTNSQLSFRADYGDIAWFGESEGGSWQMHIDNASVEDSLMFGDFAWIRRQNGNMSLKWIGGDE